MRTVAVQTFVTEPIWNSESVVTGTTGRRVEHPGRRRGHPVVAEHGNRGSGDGMLVEQVFQPLLQGVGFHACLSIAPYLLENRGRCRIGAEAFVGGVRGRQPKREESRS
jgi:hypothetical protein